MTLCMFFLQCDYFYCCSLRLSIISNPPPIFLSHKIIRQLHGRSHLVFVSSSLTEQWVYIMFFSKCIHITASSPILSNTPVFVLSPCSQLDAPPSLFLRSVASGAVSSWSSRDRCYQTGSGRLASCPIYPRQHNGANVKRKVRLFIKYSADAAKSSLEHNINF